MGADPSSGLNSTQRFSDRVDDYVRCRPSYPPGVVALLRERAALSGSSAVADVGAGTGIFTRLLLETGAQVFAVEPNEAMRRAAEAEFRGRDGFVSVAGTAEATNLAGHLVQIVTSAQAFHWFDGPAARREFMRILVPGGWCALIWNTPISTGTPFAEGYEALKNTYGTDFKRVRHESLGKQGRFAAFFGSGPWSLECLENSQTLDYEGLKGRLLSSSYAPNVGHPGHEPMLKAMTGLFDRCQVNGVVRMDYVTEIYLGKLE